MIYSMVTGDMLTFAIIFTIFLAGFSQAFYFLHKDRDPETETLFEDYFGTWMGLFQWTLGNYNVLPLFIFFHAAHFYCAHLNIEFLASVTDSLERFSRISFVGPQLFPFRRIFLT